MFGCLEYDSFPEEAAQHTPVKHSSAEQTSPASGPGHALPPRHGQASSPGHLFRAPRAVYVPIRTESEVPSHIEEAHLELTEAERLAAQRTKRALAKRAAVRLAAEAKCAEEEEEDEEAQE